MSEVPLEQPPGPSGKRSIQVIPIHSGLRKLRSAENSSGLKKYGGAVGSTGSVQGSRFEDLRRLRVFGGFGGVRGWPGANE